MISTPAGHVTPLEFHDGLTRLPLRPFTDEELVSFPHIIMTRDAHWSPRTYDPLDQIYPFPIEPRLHRVNVTSFVTSNTRRIRYNCIDRSDVNAVDHNGLNIYEQEILRVIDYESNIPRTTKRNGSEISQFV